MQHANELLAVYFHLVHTYAVSSCIEGCSIDDFVTFLCKFARSILLNYSTLDIAGNLFSILSFKMTKMNMNGETNIRALFASRSYCISNGNQFARN